MKIIFNNTFHKAFGNSSKDKQQMKRHLFRNGFKNLLKRCVSSIWTKSTLSLQLSSQLKEGEIPAAKNTGHLSPSDPIQKAFFQGGTEY